MSAPAITSVAPSTTIPRISCCSNSTISPSSTSSRAHPRLPRQGRRVQSDGRQGVYSGFQPWINRAGRFRSLGDGQVDFKAIFSRLAQYGFDRWAVLEWECCLKNAEDGAREGAAFIRDHIIRVTDRAFDDFAGGASDATQVRRALGLA